MLVVQPLPDSRLGPVAYATLTWDEVRLRLWHPFVGYVYPVRRELPDL